MKIRRMGAELIHADGHTDMPKILIDSHKTNTSTVCNLHNTQIIVLRLLTKQKNT
jgi:hypothetical protein